MKLLSPWRFVAFLCALACAQQSLAQRTGDAVYIPGGFVGTYELTLKTAPPGSIYANSTSAKLTLALDGSLCGDGLYIGKPVRSTVEDNLFYWRSAEAGLQFTLDTKLIPDEVAPTDEKKRKRGFYIHSYGEDGSGTLYGAFTGDPSAEIDAACDPNAAFFSLTEQSYPELFPGGIFTLIHMTETEFSVYYGITDTYLIITNGIASARGGKFGSTPVSLGNVKALVANGVKSLPIPVAATPTSFDDYYVGTYSMALQNAATFSPLTNGTPLKVVITKDYRLCAGETVIERGLLQDGKRVVWNNPEGGFYYQLALLPDNTREATYQQGSLGLYSSSNRLYGTFSGTRTSLNAECADAKGVDPDLTEINLMFDLAEQKLPALFPAGPLTYNQKNNGTTFRFYKASGVTVEVKSRNVLVRGGIFGAGVGAGTLDQVIATLQNSTLPVQLPSSLTGTYSMTFAAAGSFSPIATGTRLDVAITEEGSLCLDGTLYTNPSQDLNNAALVSWTNALTGYVIKLDTAASTGLSLSLPMQSLKGEVLGTLAGNKTQLLAKCVGLVSGTVKIDQANELFALAEQYSPAIFPPSALTYNQLSGGSLKRYYPSTGVLLTVTGDTVQASGGIYGSGTPLGTIDTLLAKIKAVAFSPQANLVVTGALQFKQGSLTALNRKVELADVVAMPSLTTTAELTKLVQRALSSELNGTTTYTFAIVTNTATKLEFTARLANTTTIAGTVTQRDYDLRFVYQRL